MLVLDEENQKGSPSLPPQSLAGSLAALIPVAAGDSMKMRIGGIGSASVRFG